MAKLFSLASWNVEHFRNPDSRVDRVVDFLVGLGPPDVFALYEVEGKEVYEALVTKMPGYTFHITEGPEVQEILVGVASHLTAFFTQRLEFNEGMQFLRPGALLTVTVDGEAYPILFLHTKSGTEPLGLGLRDDMFRRALSFKLVLDKAAGGDANYLFLGDLNVMGMEYIYLRDRDIRPEQERNRMRLLAESRGMKLLEKSAPATWWNGSTSSVPPSDLDQVVAAEHLSFEDLGGADVRVMGWPELSTAAEQDEWIARYSDHGCLYLEFRRP